jgi:uncharacterized DUF497 family protein
MAKGCETRIRRFVDRDTSTSNLIKHAKKCWGEDTVTAASTAKDAKEVRDKVVGSILKNGSLTASFEIKGKGKVRYSHRQHTKAETRGEIVKWVSESLRPFQIVHDDGFHTLMKTGRPGYYIPSPTTVSRDVRHVFARTRIRIASMLQVGIRHQVTAVPIS